MSYIQKTLAVLLVLALLAGCQPIMPEATPTLTSDVGFTSDDEATVDAIVKQWMQESGAPGMALAVVKDGAIVYDKGFGVAEVGTDRAVTPHTLFHMASISKSLVATALMQLVEEGKLDIDKPIVEYLPYFQVADERAKEITVRQMMSHISGMPDVPLTDPWWEAYEWGQGEDDDGALERYVRSLTDVTLTTAPGEAFLYSNIAYEVLGDLVAKLSGETFEAYMQKHIFAPLGMEESTFFYIDKPEQLALPHDPSADQGAVVSPVYPYNRAHSPSSGLLQSNDDLAKWAMASLNRGELNGERVLPAERFEEMWQPVTPSDLAEMPVYGPPVESYGMGWYAGHIGDHVVVVVPGADVGFNSQLLLVPGESMAIFGAANLSDWDNFSFPASWAVFDAAYALLGVEPEVPVSSSEAESTTLDPALVAEINAYVEDAMAENDVPGLALGIVQDGHLVLSEGFGVADLNTGAPVTPETLFLLAELSFAPTTIAALKLAGEGKLDLDAPISTYLPYFTMKPTPKGKGDAGAITVRQILTHQSGIPDSGDAMADWETLSPAFDAASTEAWVKSLAERSLNFAPGTGFEYSDIAFAVLGDVIAKVAGMPFEEYMKENILGPLGMERSTFLLEEADPVLLASPHLADPAGGKKVGAVYPYHRPFAGANNFISNASEMGLLAAALLQGAEVDGSPIISAESLDAMRTPSVDSPYADFAFGVESPSRLMQKYGYGLFVGDVDGEPAYAVFGNEHGFNNQMLLAPESNLAVFAVGNSEVSDVYYASNIATDVMAKVLEATAEE